MDLLAAAVVGVLSSFTASVLFIKALSRVRPKLESGSLVAREASPAGEVSHRFKIINRTAAPVVDVKAELHIVEDISVPAGPLQRARPLELKRADIFSLAKFDRKDERARYAYRFRTTEDIQNLWTRETEYLRLRVLAKHSVSGLSELFEWNFRHKATVIRDGVFESGDTFEIR